MSDPMTGINDYGDEQTALQVMSILFFALMPVVVGLSYFLGGREWWCTIVRPAALIIWAALGLAALGLAISWDMDDDKPDIQDYEDYKIYYQMSLIAGGVSLLGIALSGEGILRERVGGADKNYGCGDRMGPARTIYKRFTK